MCSLFVKPNEGAGLQSLVWQCVSSLKCDWLPSTGGDGFAFVIQTEGPQAVGTRGSENGFGGIENSVAIEFDTYMVCSD